jgi:hypothetical protein
MIYDVFFSSDVIFPRFHGQVPAVMGRLLKKIKAKIKNIPARPDKMKTSDKRTPSVNIVWVVS